MSYLLPNKLVLFLVLLSAVFVHQPSHALGGDAAVACEVILCLSTGNPPNECSSSLRKFFSIKASRPDKTLRARGNFLKLCPASGDSNEMGQLVDAIAQGAGACEAADLNRILAYTSESDLGTFRYIRNTMPSFCRVYYNHEYTVLGELPRYVGSVREGGYWVEADVYAAELAAYNARKEAERLERERSNNTGN